MAKFHPTFKTLVETAPEDWLPLVGQARAPVDIIDADIATVSGAADKVLRVRGRPPYLLHLEFQAGHDSANLANLLQLRHTLLDHRHDLLVRSVAVLLRPEANSPELTGLRLRRFPSEKPHLLFRYDVVRVWQIPVQRLLTGGLGTLPLAPVSDVTEARLPAIIEAMDKRLHQRPARELAAELWAATFILMGLRYSAAVAANLLRGVLSMKESVTYQAILEEGEARGKAEGTVHEAKRLLLLQGESRFGRPDAKTAAALDKINDLQHLEQLSLRLLAVNSWHELLLKPRRRQS